MKLTNVYLKQLIKKELVESKDLPKKVHAKAAKIRGEKGNKGMSRDQSYAIAANMMKEDEAGSPIMGYSDSDDSEVLEHIFNLAQDMAHAATAISSPQAKDAISEHIADILSISQEYM